MNGSVNVPAGWTRGRFWRVAGILCVVQAGLILLFSERGRLAPVALPTPGDFHLLAGSLDGDQLSKTFFALDPTVFPLPSLHGFSERGWLRLPDSDADSLSEAEPPAWLILDGAGLGTNFPTLNAAKPLLPFALGDQPSPELDPWPASLSLETVRTQSLFEIHGPLADRQLNAPAVLPPWTNTQLLSNSVVQFAVDSAGQVIAARLFGRSGSADADNDALAKARSLRFKPVSAPTPVWSMAVIKWQTVQKADAKASGAP